MGISDAFTVIGGFIVVLSAIGVGLALVRGSYTKARIEALRGDNEDLRNTANDLRQKVADLEHSRERDQLEKQSLSERVSHVEDENALLKRMVTQRADVEAVKDILEGHHKAAMAGIDMMSKKADNMQTAMTKSFIVVNGTLATVLTEVEELKGTEQ